MTHAAQQVPEDWVETVPHTNPCPYPDGCESCGN